MRNIRHLNILPYGIIKNNNTTKTLEEIFWVFSLNKSPILNKTYINEIIENNYHKQVNSSNPMLWEKVESNKDIENIKKVSIDYIVKYCNNLWIVLPKNIENEIQLFLYKWNIYFYAQRTWKTIHININIFNILSERERLAMIIHEIVHIIASKQTKIYYNYTHDKAKNELILGNISVWGHSWYHNTFVWGYKLTKLWESLNEWFTQLITLAILHESWIDMDSSYQGTHWYNIYIIDWIVSQISKKINIEYKELLKHFIAWNILGDGRYLNIIKKNLWKEFLDNLLKIWYKTDTEGNILGDKTDLLNFIEKYKLIYPVKEISNEIKEIIWNINFEINSL